MEKASLVPFLKIPVAATLLSYSKLLHLVRNPLQVLSNLSKKYGGIFQLNILHKKFIVVEDPECVKAILQEQHKIFQKYDLSGLFVKFLGNGLITNNGQTWLHQRRIIQPAFHKQQLKHMVDKIHVELDELINRLKKQNTGEPLDASTLFMELNFGIITKTLFGETAIDEVKLISGLMKSLAIESEKQVTQIIQLPLGIPLASNRRFKKVRKEFDSLLYTIISKRKRQLHEKAIIPPDILQMLLIAEPGEPLMPDKQIRDELTTLFIAGYETTSQTLAWLFYRIAMHPDIAAAIRAEIHSIPSGQLLEMQDLPQLHYTKSVIRETMRYYPSVWLMVRKNITNTVLGKYDLPRRSTVLINVFGLHHSELLWEKPEEFIPERFTEENIKKQQPFSYLPFGAGPRLCIGQPFAMMIMQIVAMGLIRNFDCKLAGNRKVEMEPHVTLRPNPGVYIRLTTISGNDQVITN